MTQSQPISELLPSKLSESILLSLALDLRRVELMVKGGAESTESLSVAMCLVFKYIELLLSPEVARKFSVQEDDLFQAIQILSITVEREIVTRIIGVSDQSGDDYFLASLKNIRV